MMGALSFASAMGLLFAAIGWWRVVNVNSGERIRQAAMVTAFACGALALLVLHLGGAI